MVQQLITDATLAAYMADLYNYPKLNFRWHYIDKGYNDHDVFFGAVWLGSVLCVVFRGTCNLGDVGRDLWAVPWPFSPLGAVHSGFDDGVQAGCKRVLQHVYGQKIIVCGHSLGAARATLAAGYMTLLDHQPIARVCWGEPRAGRDKLADIIKGIPNSRSYRNVYKGDVDPATLYPPHWLGFKFQQPGPFTDISFAPTTDGPFRLHNYYLYAKNTPQTPVSGI